MYNFGLTPRRCRVPLLLAAVLFAAASSARAQGAVGIHFGIAGGAAFPTGDAGDLYGTGYQGSVMLNLNAPVVGLRFEGMYSRMEETGAAGQSGHVQVGSATANIVIGPKTLAFRPYFIGGGGLYRLKFSATRTLAELEDTQNKPGWNAGGGISFGAGPLGRVFIEARYIRVETDPNFAVGSSFTLIPVTVGLVF